MTSLGCNQDISINNGGGPYVFKIHGCLYHQTGSLIPYNDNAVLTFGQLYIHDPQDALNFRMGQPANLVLDHGTMQILQDMLYRNHPVVQLYKRAYELTSQMPAGQDCRIALRFDQGTDHRRYNLPTTTANEIAVILPGDGA